MKSEYIRTFTGAKFYPLDPDPDFVRIEDIAHSLSLVCRWAGHVPHFYSVALHSIHVSRMVDSGQALAALLHDASEAYLGDMAKPVKLDMPDYNLAENRLMSTIALALGFDFPLTDQVKKADAAALFLEGVHFFPNTAVNDLPYTEPPFRTRWDLDVYQNYTHREAEYFFLAEYRKLKLNFSL
jgi:5'-nucleotidase